MNPPPVPFGDPAQIQRQRSAAVRKGVLFGCGGCAVFVLIAVGFISGILFLVMSVIRTTGPVQQTLRAAQSSAVMTEALGEPIEVGWFITGSVKTENNQTEADVTVPLAGPKGKASVHSVGTRTGNAAWQFSEMSATIEATGQTADLRRR